MNQKLEDLLQLALLTPEEIRVQTEELNVGFHTENRTWELIVKYHGSLDMLEALGVDVEYLIAGYAVLTVPEQLVDRVAELEEIEYVEKPKRYFYEAEMPTDKSCIAQVTLREPNLSGAGVLVAVLDSGIDYKLPEFRHPDGSTRIRFLWDQTLRPDAQAQLPPVRRPPAGYRMGAEFDSARINQALAASTEQEQFQLLPSVDTSGHGTAVAGIAAGSTSVYQGVAPEAELLIVKLGLPDAASFPRTTEIMRAVTYAIQKAIELQMPLVINLSFGNTYGAHDGSSLIERFLDNAAEIGRTVICVGAGNEGNSAGHLSGSLLQENPAGGGDGVPSRVGPVARPASVELAVAEYERTLNVQLWKNYCDTYRIFLRSPGGQETQLPAMIDGGKYTLRLEQTEIMVYFGNPAPYAVAEEIYAYTSGYPVLVSAICKCISEELPREEGREDLTALWSKTGVEQAVAIFLKENMPLFESMAKIAPCISGCRFLFGGCSGRGLLFSAAFSAVRSRIRIFHPATAYGGDGCPGYRRNRPGSLCKSPSGRTASLHRPLGCGTGLPAFRYRIPPPISGTRTGR